MPGNKKWLNPENALIKEVTQVDKITVVHGPKSYEWNTLGVLDVFVEIGKRC